MVCSGELCAGCTRYCSDPPTREQTVEIACIYCNGTCNGSNGEPCEECDGTGTFSVTECPNKFVGFEMSDNINYAQLANKGHLPESGGVLDQSAYFVSIWKSFTAEMNQIEADRIERMNNK